MQVAPNAVVPCDPTVIYFTKQCNCITPPAREAIATRVVQSRERACVALSLRALPRARPPRVLLGSKKKKKMLRGPGTASAPPCKAPVVL